MVTYNHNHFKATLSFRGSTSSTRDEVNGLVTATLLIHKVISTKHMYIKYKI